MTMTKILSRKTCSTYGHGPLINHFHFGVPETSEFTKPPRKNQERASKFGLILGHDRGLVNNCSADWTYFKTVPTLPFQENDPKPITPPPRSQAHRPAPSSLPPSTPVDTNRQNLRIASTLTDVNKQSSA